MQLEAELSRAKHKEKRVMWILPIAYATSVILMFIGGSKLFGSFDPWSSNANVVSLALGAIYLIAMVATPMLLAYYLSNLWPRIRRLKNDLLQHSANEQQHSIHELRHELRDLRNEIEATRRTEDGGKT